MKNFTNVIRIRSACTNEQSDQSSQSASWVAEEDQNRLQVDRLIRLGGCVCFVLLQHKFYPENTFFYVPQSKNVTISKYLRAQCHGKQCIL